jgi:hypothetical protein
MGFLGEIHVVFQLSLIGLFGTKKAYLKLEKPKLQKVFLQKLIQLSSGNIMLMFLLLTLMVFF